MCEPRANALHVKCDRDDNGKLKGVVFDRETQTYRSGWWAFNEDEAAALVGGWLYLHADESLTSEMGGQVLSYELAQVTARGNEARVIFLFDYAAAARQVAWRGPHPPKRTGWSGGFVDATLPHEANTGEPPVAADGFEPPTKGL